jgi:hypothetical protein
MSKWFFDIFIDIAIRAIYCGSLLERVWLAQGVNYEGTRWTREFTWFEPSKRNILRSQKNESCIAVFCPNVDFALNRLKRICRLPGPFMAQGRTVTIRPKARQVASGLGKTLCSMTLMARSSK